MPKIFITLLFILFLVLNCSQQENDADSVRINGKKLQLLVKDASQGDAKSNFKLSGFLISYTPPGEKYNQLFIDSTITPAGLKLYSVLLEFPNPLFNILAVYDEYLNLYLQDNSLNGNIATEWKSISGKQYLVNSEHFISKDKIELSRLSLYSFDESKLSLVFRSFTKLKNSGSIHEQTINVLSDNKITTHITSNRNKALKNKTVTHNYSSTDNKYISRNDIFNNFVLAEVNNANWKTERPELTIETVEKIKEELKRTNRDEDSNLNEGTREYRIELDSDWFDPVNIFVTEHLSKTLKGNLYVNNKLGAQITIIKLPEGSDATQFVKYQFDRVTEGANRVRSSKLVTSDNNIIQVFEHSCANKSFILILQAPKFTYEKNNNNYRDIVKTFSVEC